MALDTHRQMDAAAYDDFFSVIEQIQESMLITVADLENQLATLRQ
ncbi:hypothetical protein [Paraburkholderia youngii]